ncbi:GNAT family N-acetyltransferase [Limosilactobacillus antri]|uniref:Acetyltransferase, GNAT family n=1 Tax=Limosilactobacillus antri DSM 16041 TaxID=525309 RepID=C8P6X0_9LACO|nr:GNAT family N-acetyltransferase [Limosilactobacillus antri]EEW53766.1 acetyltransferase, GNAT family [Limosilactobacillus antri DSM 16041]KRK59024.1 hypothetical protein FC31_GL000907 [Limosilactobacillus antri DSM 16041]
MADEVQIKLAAADDAANILAFLRKAATESDAVLIPHLADVTVEQERRNIEMINSFDDCVIMLAMLGGQPIGIVTVMVLEDQPGVGELGVVVAKPYWRNGIGQLLVDEAEYWFQNYSSLQQLVLTVFAENVPAIRLYQKLGFRQTGRHQAGQREVLEMEYQKRAD